ncbi:Hypothetical protein CulFRC11_1765 [Corynebacterium ramonii]|uniref:Uncharacterized protein n=1 Tax=Corynebacterium ramonii TaxID=3026968 RepID=A0ABN4EKC7_9CORY|nr:Hypothetical protein CulFRC11_1765 [Corynebacterium ramonii FRC0011]
MDFSVGFLTLFTEDALLTIFTTLFLVVVLTHELPTLQTEETWVMSFQTQLMP